MRFCNGIVLTYERRVSLIPVPDLQVVVLAFPWGAGGLDEEPVSKVDPDEVSRGRSDGPEAGDVRAVLLGIHGRVELHPGRVSVGEILAELFQLLRVVFGFVGRRRRSTLHRRSKSGKTFALSTQLSNLLLNQGFFAHFQKTQGRLQKKLKLTFGKKTQGCGDNFRYWDKN